MDIHIVGHDDDALATVQLTGDLDVLVAPRVHDAVERVHQAGCHHLVIDLNQVSFIDSAGLGVLVGALKAARREDGTLRLVCQVDKILRLLRITELIDLFEIHPDTDTALAAARADLASRAGSEVAGDTPRV